MKEKFQKQNELKNARGKRLLEKTFLEYSLEIIRELEQNPMILPQILDELEITEIEFMEYISGKNSANITMYDQALTLVKRKNKDNSNLKK